MEALADEEEVKLPEADGDEEKEEEAVLTSLSLPCGELEGVFVEVVEGVWDKDPPKGGEAVATEEREGKGEIDRDEEVDNEAEEDTEARAVPVIAPEGEAESEGGDVNVGLVDWEVGFVGNAVRDMLLEVESELNGEKDKDGDDVVLTESVAGIEIVIKDVPLGVLMSDGVTETEVDGELDTVMEWKGV